MRASLPRSWLGAVVLAGSLYALVGILFAIPTQHVQAWRLAAWAASAVAYATHLAYEILGRGARVRTAALHVAVAVALGAFGLAVGANVHALAVGSSGSHRRLLLLALGIWPVMTVVPAFLVALAVGAAAGRTRWRARGAGP
jgi:hypothetical protein